MACVLQYAQDPINQAIDHTGTYTVHDHRAGDGEHLGGGAEDEAFCVWSGRTHIFVLY